MFESEKSANKSIDVWTIAGFDPCGGAGLLADRQVFTANGLKSYALMSAQTAQNEHCVTKVDAIEVSFITEQFNLLRQHGWPRVIKVGLLLNVAMVRCLSELLKNFPGILVYDPVMVASSGKPLMQKEVIAELKSYWLSQVNIMTPNIDEATCLSGIAIYSTDDMQKAAYQLCHLGVPEVIIKGGHLGGEWAQDIWCDGQNHCWLTLPRLRVPSLHGSGCQFSAALASGLALGLESQDAFVFAKMQIQQAFTMQSIITHVQESAVYFPWLTQSALFGQHRPTCKPLQQSLGFYTIINDIRWLTKLEAWGVKTIQLRLKEEDAHQRAGKVAQAVKLIDPATTQLFINDDWQAAIKYKAYGVHLGQEDIKQCDMNAIKEAGLRLGISTHSLSELARAKAYQPSYIAFGPIFTTTSKVMAFPAQGLTKLKQWRKWVNEPLVAIGGITTANLETILACKVDSVAVISAVTKAVNPQKACQQFLSSFSART
ncbi:bifunctional hydroxymethylpyrimidine kinase/phosphomethylpyrimidine kinase [Candidatus Berkiella aquae]|uniref:Bifunctional hydroxymethylpyrimidine kinase/phosphomethylpyrimidine kinase n=1 Tax=Candidatus Berkiella aquae TaxID=295108 RepID=A0A0Q9YWU1_9GAMM|nr:bifunctional hydroxymethylpyrimidine kinase/phosphomethylpyrimidine kinase [Candidatus Berkiella aquae]MCS5712603.1 bifunctional hydroxymethylpyrimidine kinase/phosphomethylpyrimidine kinase [Candidatus Berkiella aquae]